MLAEAIWSKLEDLALELTTKELTELRVFLMLVEEVRGLNLGQIAQLRALTLAVNNPYPWNLIKVLDHEVFKREKKASRTELGRRMANVPSDDPSWQQSPWKERLAEARGTMVPPSGDFPPNGIYRPTKPQPGDE